MGLEMHKSTYTQVFFNNTTELSGLWLDDYTYTDEPQIQKAASKLHAISPSVVLR